MSNARALYPQHQIRRRARGTALHWNCSSPPLSLSLRPQFTLCRDLVEAASQIKSGRTRSLPLCGSAPSRCREIATGDAFSCNKKWAANFFCLGMFLFTDCHPPLSAPCPPSPRLEDSVCNFSSQRRPRCIKDKMHGKLEEGTAPNFDRAPDD